MDDEPATVAGWLPVAAAAVGARAPRRMPRWLVRLLAGEFATVMMTDLRGRLERQGQVRAGVGVRYPSWRQGFVTALG